MLEMLKNKSMVGIVLLLVGFTYIKTLPQPTFQEGTMDDNLFLYVEEN